MGIVINLFFMLGVLLSINLWQSDRFFPLVPVFDVTETIPPFVNLTLLILFILALASNLFIQSARVNYAVMTIGACLLIQDQMRWQPWVYMYLLMLLPYNAKNNEEAHPFYINYLQIIVISVYLWSGIHKINPDFLNTNFKNILIHLLNLTDPVLFDKIKLAGYVIPAMEILTGVFLLLPRTRTAGVYLAISIHVFILIYLSPLGIDGNSVVYPWNVAMICVVTLLFFGMKNPPSFWRFTTAKSRIFTLSIASLCLVMPVLNFYRLWDNYLSFSLYSEKNSRFYIAIEQNELNKIDRKYAKYVIEISGMSGGKIIDVNKWSLLELNVPVYPETRVFKKVCKRLCRYGIPNDKIIFLELTYPLARNEYHRFTCEDL